MSVYTQEAFDDWRSHPITRRLLLKLSQESSILRDTLVYHSDCNVDEHRGRIKATEAIINVEYEDLVNDN